jgi:hypothetical protein
MKKRSQKTLLALIFLLVSNFVMAQAPNKMSYQAVIRDNSNALVTNQIVGMQISILQIQCKWYGSVCRNPNPKLLMQTDW